MQTSQVFAYGGSLMKPIYVFHDHHTLQLQEIIYERSIHCHSLFAMSSLVTIKQSMQKLALSLEGCIVFTSHGKN